MPEWTLIDLIRKNRSIRRFQQSERISLETLRGLVNLARLSASGANLQPLKYLLVYEPDLCGKVFPTLGWAGYLKDWSGPTEGERPAAYVLLLLDTEIAARAPYDAGIACQSMLLGAVEQGYGGCILASVRRSALRESIHIPDRYEILLVLALGKPAEEVRIEDVRPDGDIRYWRDEQGLHHVPKRSLQEIILEF